MKKSIIAMTFICFMNNIQAQDEPKKIKKENMTNMELKEYYVKKSKGQKTGAWVLLGSGILISAISAGSAANNLDFNNPNSQTGNDVGFIIGSSCMLGSIPLFILGSKNKKRATLIVQQNHLPIIPGMGRNITMKSVGIGISIGQ